MREGGKEGGERKRGKEGGGRERGRREGGSSNVHFFVFQIVS